MIRWLTEPVPRGRLAAFRTVIYLFVAADLVFFTPWVRTRVSVPGELYQPLLAGRLLHLPTPTPELVAVIFWALLGLALLAATGRAPRLLGWSVFALYLEWMIVAMSYGKVDHDRFGLLVALAVLPTVGRARHGDPTRSEAAGWALRVTQIAVVCTYFLAAWAKLRFGGPDWLTGSVLARAIIRRGTELADLIAQVPYLLIVAQFGIIAFELASPVVFLLPARWRSLTVGFFYSFHLVTFATITISFAPHLAAMTAFLPLERVRPIHWLRGLRRSGSPTALGQLGEHPLTAADDDLRPAPLGEPEQGVLGPVPPAPLGLGGGLPEPPHVGVVLDPEPGGQADPVPADQPARLRGNLGVEPEPGVA
ncbi:HTTM domain-containing protein [Micromonospora sp. WP24]|uniref:HTTM domain-containing protein n=1 Tax=Micromonospora sp. WP24 TaxID=2604469 RepID=UPI0021076279|nr:HTTM domain-containing protein [Micromonospora sp. WP24]